MRQRRWYEQTIFLKGDLEEEVNADGLHKNYLDIHEGKY